MHRAKGAITAVNHRRAFFLSIIWRLSVRHICGLFILNMLRTQDIFRAGLIYPDLLYGKSCHMEWHVPGSQPGYKTLQNQFKRGTHGSQPFICC